MSIRCPHFTEAYLNLSVANSIYPGNPEKAISLMEEVLASVDSESQNLNLEKLSLNPYLRD